MHTFFVRKCVRILGLGRKFEKKHITLNPTNDQTSKLSGLRSIVYKQPLHSGLLGWVLFYTLDAQTFIQQSLC